MSTHSYIEHTTTTAQPRRLGLAWKTILVVEIGILVWGLMALLNPKVLTEGYETFTDRSWDTFAAADPQAADFVLAGFRLVGLFNVAVAVTLMAIAATAFRRNQPWSWWTLLAGTTMAISGPIIYDQYVGYIGPYEVLEYVGLLATYVALYATSPMVRGTGRRKGQILEGAK